LDEVGAVTGIHRKPALLLLRHELRLRPTLGPDGCPRRYSPAVTAAAEVLWQASGRIGAHRLQPLEPELLERLLQGGDLTLSQRWTSWCGRRAAPRSPGCL
jgi:hypothetical protein